MISQTQLTLIKNELRNRFEGFTRLTQQDEGRTLTFIRPKLGKVAFSATHSRCFIRLLFSRWRAYSRSYVLEPRPSSPLFRTDDELKELEMEHLALPKREADQDNHRCLAFSREELTKALPNVEAFLNEGPETTPLAYSFRTASKSVLRKASVCDIMGLVQTGRLELFSPLCRDDLGPWFRVQGQLSRGRFTYYLFDGTDSYIPLRSNAVHSTKAPAFVTMSHRLQTTSGRLVREKLTQQDLELTRRTVEQFIS